MSTDMQLYCVASLLRRGHSLDQFSTGLALLGVALGLAPWWQGIYNPWVLTIGCALLLLGAVQKYWAFRVAFDADLFQRMADSPSTLSDRTQALDQALAGLGLQAAKRGDRPWPERSRSALTLLRRQAMVLGAQLLLTLGGLLASPWWTI
ncbi:hypothetical protein GPJ81_08435 [Pseudomonas alkylphenolica]|jgi:hypothetical protein|uniref:Uncharacterized protein n=1 Tax=Pseudomonas alkylphenolica TaxID=237609 RepID=A0A6I6GXH7_9PSED|nr:hypothetical protein [Pseudomonas alkylphenolica]QGW76696.1 hypothetical protein GPJ81_08435 [Pseudomonas alkylphenolica]